MLTSHRNLDLVNWTAIFTVRDILVEESGGSKSGTAAGLRREERRGVEKTT